VFELSVNVTLNLNSFTETVLNTEGKFLCIGFMWQMKEKIYRKETSVIILEKN